MKISGPGNDAMMLENINEFIDIELQATRKDREKAVGPVLFSFIRR